MKHLTIFSVATLAFSISACGQSETISAAQTIEIADPHGVARRVTILATERTATEGYAEVRMNGRDFTLDQWTDLDTGVRHNVVSSNLGDLRYDYIDDGLGAKVELTDATGTRIVSNGETLGSLDPDAATLLMNFRPAGVESDVGIAHFQSYCIYYDTSNPDDWHLSGGSCTCAHWYSLICRMNV